MFAQWMVIVNAADTLLKQIDRRGSLRLSNTTTSNIVHVQDEEDLDGGGGEGTHQEIIEGIDASFQPGISHNRERKEKERVKHNCRRRKQMGTQPVYNPRETVLSTILRGKTEKGWDVKLRGYYHLQDLRQADLTLQAHS